MSAVNYYVKDRLQRLARALARAEQYAREIQSLQATFQGSAEPWVVETVKTLQSLQQKIPKKE